MKLRLLLASLICSAITVTGLFGQDAKAPAADQTELGAQMEKMNAAFRRLRTQVADPAKADPAKMESSVAAVVALRQAAEAAMKFEPARKAEIPAADQAKWVADYRAKLKETIAEIVKLEEAIKGGKNEEAAKIFAAIGQMQKDGHKAYKTAPKKKE